MNLGKSEKQLVDRLGAVMDRYKGRYRELNGAQDLGEYLPVTALAKMRSC